MIFEKDLFKTYPKTKYFKIRDIFNEYWYNFSDYADQIGMDTSALPRFDCEKCDGKMIPIYYVGAKGRIYEYTEDS